VARSDVTLEVVELWLATREGWLFEDIDYVQWGLHLLDPAGGAVWTQTDLADRPDDFDPNDIVVGEIKSGDVVSKERPQRPLR
jgi:hypothetical protein